MSNLLGIAVKGVASGIGLASESIHAYKAKNHDKDNNSNETTITDADSTRQLIREEDDEEDWELDEAQEALTPQETKTKPSRDITILVQQFVSRHPLPSGVELSSIPRLALPVILPQRRPKDRSRGFIRAYAPLLEDCEVDQAAFFDFLDVFNQATLASPWIQAINLAGIAGFFLPGATSLAITAAVMLTIKASQEVQGRQKLVTHRSICEGSLTFSRTNTFLDKINDEFFRPRGLYCLILTWNPETASVQSTFSLAETISSSTSTGTGFQKVTKKFQTSSGNTYGDLEIPQAAPLIFPGLDTLALRSGEGVVKKVSKLKKSKGFVENYMDRRARAKFVGFDLMLRFLVR